MKLIDNIASEHVFILFIPMMCIMLFFLDDDNISVSNKQNQQAVIQYSASGQPIAYWLLTNRKIREYCRQPKIEFIDMNGCEVKLATNYIIIEVDDNLDYIKQKYNLYDIIVR